ncbi:MAG TPA: hypothetical protein VL133_10165, partial [Devosia sp.]|nr:hypothetical protein [Devosia sp.]
KLEERRLRLKARTLGEMLFIERGPALKPKKHRTDDDPAKYGTVRVRPQKIALDDGKTEDGYGFYPERSFLRTEFDEIWAAQAAFYPDILTEERHDHLALVMFYQRPLKAAIIGKCSFNNDEFRLAKAHPLFQEFRL